MLDVLSCNSRNLLGIIGSLPSQELGWCVELCEIADCADQSSGKSSVLEATAAVLVFPDRGITCGFASATALPSKPNSGACPASRRLLRGPFQRFLGASGPRVGRSDRS